MATLSKWRKALWIAVLALLSSAAAEVLYQVTPRFADHTFSSAEYAEYLANMREIYNGGIDYIWSHTHYAFFDMFIPTFKCADRMERYPGGLVDGGKYVCSGGDLMQKGQCIVYSFGSEGNYLFEAEIRKNFECEIHTFDCFGDYGVHAPPGVTFHKWCVSGQDKGSHYTISSIMDMLGHARVDYLKMDVEGYEYFAIPDLANLPRERLPIQVGLEIHPWASFPNQRRNHATLRATVELMNTFHRLGYRLTSREDNCGNHCCSEFVYILAGDDAVK